MALMWNTAHIGTIGLVKMLELPGIRQTVERWENHFATSFHIQSRLLYEFVRTTAISNYRRSRGSALSCELHNICKDAINSNLNYRAFKAFVYAIRSRCRDAQGHHVNHSIYFNLQHKPIHCHGTIVREMFLMQSQSAVKMYGELHFKLSLLSPNQSGDKVGERQSIPETINDFRKCPIPSARCTCVYIATYINFTMPRPPHSKL